ncbi:MAG TPA: hypothetical protein VLG36_00905 [Candidatus Chromulinivoraceae bacterium]|nr:hypothetical protein [Candidatus Chromulinivoraceae bacterium]
MKVSKLVLLAGIISIVGIGSLTSTAFAWHPKGVIVKKVQNVTTNSVLSDADTSATAIAAKPGDTLRYVITVTNNGAVDNSGNNDMAKTVMTDTLPSGVELVSNPAQRQISENLGTIKPGKSVTKEYLVKVTSSTDGSITNTACFTGNSTANDNPQQGCNPAVVTVTVPEIPVTPVTPVTPEQPVTETPAELPHTGMAENVIMSSLILGAIAYISYLYFNSRRELTNIQ